MSEKVKQAKKVPLAATPWGRATILEELVLRQQAGQQRFASHVQLLEAANGEQLVRFAYSSDGPARRGPVTLRARDVAKLREGLARRPALAAALGLGGDA
jgi:hypothetical protein